MNNHKICDRLQDMKTNGTQLQNKQPEYYSTDEKMFSVQLISDNEIFQRSHVCDFPNQYTKLNFRIITFQWAHYHFSYVTRKQILMTTAHDDVCNENTFVRYKNNLMFCAWSEAMTNATCIQGMWCKHTPFSADDWLERISLHWQITLSEDYGDLSQPDNKITKHSRSNTE